MLLQKGEYRITERSEVIRRGCQDAGVKRRQSEGEYRITERSEVILLLQKGEYRITERSEVIRRGCQDARVKRRQSCVRPINLFAVLTQVTIHPLVSLKFGCI